MQCSSSDTRVSLWKYAGQLYSVWSTLWRYSQWLPAVRGISKILQHLLTSKWLLLLLVWTSLSPGSPDLARLACHHLSWLLFFSVSSSRGFASFSYIKIVNQSSSVPIKEKYSHFLRKAELLKLFILLLLLYLLYCIRAILKIIAQTLVP